MNDDKTHCPKCKLLFDCNNHIPRILNCGHTLCSYCIIEQIQLNKNSISCPIDNTVYNNIVSVDSFKENTNLIEEIKESLDIPINHNYEISNDDIFFDNDKSLIMNSDKFNDTLNSLNFNASIISSSNCYLRKSKIIRNKIKETNNTMCEKHTLPLNVICIDEKIQICSQCALNNEHVNHQIITEEEFMNNIDNLIDLFQEIDNNQNKYLSFNNINTKLILDNIGNNIENYIKIINKTKNEMIDNINLQCENIEKYLNNRKKEIIDKYQSINFDISNLRESTLTWMQNVTHKLDQLNNINSGDDKGCIKLLDNDINKNIFNLLRNGKQLNGRYNFVQQNIKIIDKLKTFDKNGINIIPNKKIIDRLFIYNKNNENAEGDVDKPKESNKIEQNENNIDINLNIDEIGKQKEIKNNNNNENNNEIKTTLFKIMENNDLINSLNLTKFKFDFIDNDITDKKEIIDQISKNEEQEKVEKENKEDKEDKEEKEEKEEMNKKEEKIEIKDDINIMTFSNKKENNNNNIENRNENDIFININENINNKYENNINNNDNKENKNDKNNISKIIDEVTFNDDTLLINPLTTNQNENIYHKKIKKDKPLELKILKKKENSNSKKETNNQLISESQTQSKIKTKGITTKKIDISELRNHKLSIDNRSVDKDIKDNYFNFNNSSKNLKNEIIININKRKSEHKNTLPIGINNVKQSKKNLFKQNSGDKSPKSLLISRSPGRLVGQSRLAGFYNFLPFNKNNNNMNDNNNINTNNDINNKLDSIQNQNNCNEKAIIKKHFTNRNRNIKVNCYNKNDTNPEYSLSINERKKNICINKNINPNKTIFKENTQNNNLIKKMNSSKYIIDEEIKNEITNKYSTNNVTSLKTKINKLGSSNTIHSVMINNSNNSYDNKSKKELQEFINNQFKNNIPNFSRINMNGFGIQYLCSYLHKNPNSNYKEIKLLGCNIDDDDLFILTRTLLDHDIGLLVLNLSSNKITDESAANILDLLKDCKSLKGLSLYNNMIGDILKEKLIEYSKLGRKNFEIVQLYI